MQVIYMLKHKQRRHTVKVESFGNVFVFGNFGREKIYLIAKNLKHPVIIHYVKFTSSYKQLFVHTLCIVVVIR